MPRAKLDPKDIPDYFTETQRRASPYDTKYERHTYRIPEQMHGQLKDVAIESGIGLNDLVRWIFQQFIDGHLSGDIVLPVEEYVVTKSRLSE